MPNRRRARRPPADPKQRLIAAALELAASKGWRQTSLAEIAAAAEIPLDETYALFRSKAALLREFRRGIDAAVLGQRAPAASDPPRDRLFDVLMRRFEALKPHRAGLRAILRDMVGDPAMLHGLQGLVRSMSWMRAAARLPVTGCWGRLAAQLTAGLYLSVLPVFLRDESTDLGSTMAALDRRLRQAETVLGSFRPIIARAAKPQK
jgi:AcrR family transcriptional regulator